MKWVATSLLPTPLYLEIEHDPAVGYYIYVWERNRQGKGLYDYLQDSLEIAKRFAFQRFGVPLDAWREVTE